MGTAENPDYKAVGYFTRDFRAPCKAPNFYALHKSIRTMCFSWAPCKALEGSRKVYYEAAGVIFFTQEAGHVKDVLLALEPRKVNAKQFGIKQEAFFES